MNPAKIDAEKTPRRRAVVERARRSSEIEGGHSTATARVLQDRWVQGSMSYVELGRAIAALHPSRKSL